MKKNQYIIAGVVVGLLLMGTAFFAGTRYQAGKQVSFGEFGNRSAIPQRGLGQQNRQPGNGMVSGNILGIDGQSLTVQLADGSSKIILIANSTTYEKSQAGTLADVVVGGRVTVLGTSNSDGSVTAKTVILGDRVVPRLGL